MIAAIFLDKGFESAKAFVLREIVPIIDKVIGNQYRKDYKTMLQEHVQKLYKKVPFYTLEGSTGPEHDQVFYYSVTVQGKTYGPATGHNKKASFCTAAETHSRRRGDSL